MAAPIDSVTYNVFTDLDPQALTEVGMAIYAKWVAFAMARDSLGGKKLMYPTGKYASAIHFRKYGTSRVAIIADETQAPEAHWLEVGHAAYDMKTGQNLAAGMFIPMHRGRPGHYGSAGQGKPQRNQSAARNAERRKNFWTQSVKKPNMRPSSGGAFVTQDALDDPDAWVIPEMAAYSPAAHLVDLIASAAALLGG
jgi:hypothetical protein